MRWFRWAVAVLLLGSLAVLGACSSEDPPAATRKPRLGAPSPTTSTPPAGPMDMVERSVAKRLASRLEDEALTLEYVDCPPRKAERPSALTCTGYVDGLVVPVGVQLSRGGHGGTEFDAWLGEGIVATARLVGRLEREGYAHVDCGSVRAYPARLGMRIVCRVRRHGGVGYLVATVTDRHGAVRIQDY